MPAQAQRQTQTTAPAVATPALATANTEHGDNSQKVAELPNIGKLTYERALGDFLGGHLYKLVSKEISKEKLEKLADGAVSDAFAALAEFVAGQAEPKDTEMAAKFTTALQEAMEPRIQELLSDSNLAGGIESWAAGHPRTILAAALAGAAAYILSNQKIPEIEKKIGLGGGNAILLGVDLGKTMDISLNSVKAGYRYSSDKTDASVTGDYELDSKKYGIDASLTHKMGFGDLSLTGNSSGGPDGGTTGLAAALSGGLGPNGQYNLGASSTSKNNDPLDLGLSTVSGSYDWSKANTSASITGSHDFDTSTTAMGVRGSTQGSYGTYSGSADYSTSPKGYSASVAAALKNQDLSAKIFGKSSNLDGKRLNTLGMDLTGKYGQDSKYYMGGEAGTEGWKAKAGWSMGNEEKRGAWSLGAEASDLGGKKDYKAMLGYKLRF